MKVNYNLLKNAINNCYLIIDKKSKIPILKNIGIEFLNESFRFYSTNLDEYYSETIYLKKGKIFFDDMTTETFDHLIDFEKLQKTIKTGKNEVVDVTIDKKEFSITNNVKYTLKSDFDLDDYPCFDSGLFKTELKLDKSILFDMLKNMDFITANGHIDYSSVLFAKNEDQVDLIGTDIYRISVCSTKEFSINRNFVLSHNTIKNIQKIFKNSDFNVVRNDTWIKFYNATQTYVAKIKKNNYPNYKIIINPLTIETSFHFSFNKNDIKDKLNSIVEYYKDDSVISTILKVNSENLKVEALGTNDKIETDIKIINKDHDDKEISVNAKYLNEFIKNITNDIVKAIIDDGRHPLLLFQENEKYEYYHMVMPLRTI